VSAIIGSSAALISPDKGGSALLNSASGTIGASVAGEAGVDDCRSAARGASGPFAGAEPGCASCAAAGWMRPLALAAKAMASQ
jgi:hypothetical protein